MPKSQYGDRETIGSIALKAAQNTDIPIVGDLGHELMPSLVEDLNNAIASNPYDGKPFYIIVHEKKDLLLKNTLLRRILTTTKRPYPEDNTSVFWTDPRREMTCFCWSLPHKSLFNQVLANPERYGEEQVNDVKAYKAEKMERFGFQYLGLDKKTNSKIYTPIKGFEDRPVTHKKQRISPKILLSA